jgi:putative FmdB family regulatory protein
MAPPYDRYRWHSTRSSAGLVGTETTGEREEDRRMPTYEYACRKCGEHLEVVQAFTDDALTTCPNCGGPLRKVFGRVGISFKGDGFYKTDSRKTSSASSRSDQAEKSEKSDSAPKVAATNGSGDSKPAKPAESTSGATSDSKPSKPSTPAASA